MAAEKKPKKTAKKAKGSKVFDVAKPGKGKVDIGSKPMIVGHKSMASDPMMRDEKTEEDLAKEIEESVAQTSKVKIEPLSEDMKKSEEQDDTVKNKDVEKDADSQDDADTNTSQSELDDSAKDTLDTDTQSDDTQEDKSDVSEPSKDEATDDGQDDASKPEEGVDTESSKEDSNDDDTPKDDDTTSSDDSKDAEDKKDSKKVSDASKDEDGKDEKSKDPELDPAAVEMERDENLRKIIESKTYRLNIKESSSPSASMMPIRTKIIAAVVAIVVLLAGLFVLVDTKTLDLGFELPFSVFDSEDATVSNQESVEQIADENIQSAAKSENETSTSPESPAAPDQAPILTDDWFEFTSPGYTIRIPDGYVLTKKETSETSLFATSLVYESGTRGVVQDYTSGSPNEFATGFFMDYSDAAPEQSCASFYNEGIFTSFTTQVGDEVRAAKLVGTIPVEQRSLGEVAEGETSYSYCIQNGSKRLSIGLTDDSEKADQAQEVLEAAIKTIEFVQ